MNPTTRRITVTVNGRVFEEDVEPRQLLVYFLRETIGLTGTHVGCLVGECGACSILLDGKLIKSCQMLAVQADGRAVTTVEGLAKDGVLHPIQEAFVANFALQCGYCTPGMIMTSYYLLQQYPEPTEDQIRRRLSGNLCMCTGYAQIIQAVQAASKSLKHE